MPVPGQADADALDPARRRPARVTMPPVYTQCMMGAMTAGAGATGVRSWIATRTWAWLTPIRLKRITLALLTVAVVAATFLIGGSTPPPPP